MAVDGVSLTIAELDDTSFTVSLIPETLERTNLGGARAGSRVNLEVDVLAKYVEKLVGAATMSATKATFATIEEALEDIREGKMVVVCDDETRENEGDLTMAAQFVTPDAINFMRKEGGGLICLALTSARCDELGLDLMAAKNESAFETAFTVSIEARVGRQHRDLGRRPGAHDPGRDRPRDEPPTSSSSRDTCSRSRPSSGACSSGSDRPRRRSTWRASPG